MNKSFATAQVKRTKRDVQFTAAVGDDRRYSAEAGFLNGAKPTIWHTSPVCDTNPDEAQQRESIDRIASVEAFDDDKERRELFLRTIKPALDECLKTP